MYKLLFLCIILFVIPLRCLAIEKDEYIIIDFSASWCGPCQQLKKSFADEKMQSFLEDNKSIVRFQEVSSDNQPEAHKDWKIKKLPTIIIAIKNKRGETWKELGRLTGFHQTDDLLKFLEKYIPTTKTTTPNTENFL